MVEKQQATQHGPALEVEPAGIPIAMVALTRLGHVQPVLGVVPAALAGSAWRRAWRPALHSLTCVAMAEAVVTALQSGLGIPCPVTMGQMTESSCRCS